MICSCPALMPVFCSKYRSIFYNSNLFVIWLAEIFVKSGQDHYSEENYSARLHEPMKLGKVPCEKSHLQGSKGETKLEHPEKACPL